MRNTLFAALSVLVSLCAVLLTGEVVCRFLPVNDGLIAMPVNETDPVFRFTPNRNMTWSRDWNFSIINRLRVNNRGYVNAQDYDADDPRPLLAVVGDSYVEAAMVPYSETLQGHLAAEVKPSARVYSFGASGAALSQYLVWAREARRSWKAGALVVVVVGNDFDESLTSIRASPGFHQYVATSDDRLSLRRNDYRPGPFRIVVRHSALARYLFFNLQAQEHLRQLFQDMTSMIRSARAGTFVGNTAAAVGAERMRSAQAVVRTFLRDLSDFAGWQPNEVVFVVDGIRYPADDPAIMDSFFVRIRDFFIAEARRLGYEAIDMDAVFVPRFRATHERYDHPTDGHWNGLAHRLAAEAVRHAKVFARWRTANGLDR